MKTWTSGRVTPILYDLVNHTQDIEGHCIQTHFNSKFPAPVQRWKSESETETSFAIIIYLHVYKLN